MIGSLHPPPSLPRSFAPSLTVLPILSPSASDKAAARGVGGVGGAEVGEEGREGVRRGERMEEEK